MWIGINSPLKINGKNGGELVSSCIVYCLQSVKDRKKITNSIKNIQLIMIFFDDEYQTNLKVFNVFFVT